MGQTSYTVVAMMTASIDMHSVNSGYFNAHINWSCVENVSAFSMDTATQSSGKVDRRVLMLISLEWQWG